MAGQREKRQVDQVRKEAGTVIHIPPLNLNANLKHETSGLERPIIEAASVTPKTATDRAWPGSCATGRSLVCLDQASGVRQFAHNGSRLTRMHTEHPNASGNSGGSSTPRASKLPVSRLRQPRALPHNDGVRSNHSGGVLNDNVAYAPAASSCTTPAQIASKSRLATQTGRTLARGPSGAPAGSAHGAESQRYDGKGSLRTPSRAGAAGSIALPTRGQGAPQAVNESEISDQQISSEQPLATSSLDAVPSARSSSPSKAKAPRLSLSDRTMGSIQNLPLTPKDRRRSNFFSPVDSPMGPPPRPTPSPSRGGGTDSSGLATREGVTRSHGTPLPSVTRPRTSISALKFPPSSAGRQVARPTSPSRAIHGKHNISSFTEPPSILTSSNSARALQRTPKIPAAGDIVTARPLKGRSALPSTTRPVAADSILSTRAVKADSTHSPVRVDHDEKAAQPAKTSSTALRQQIAAAKAAARGEKIKRDSAKGLPVHEEPGFDSNSYSDPFGLGPKDYNYILKTRINTARMTGKLNIAALGVKQIPVEVMRMYDPSALEVAKVNWAEIVDVTKFIAADNEIDVLDEKLFPDSEFGSIESDEELEGGQFGGLEMFDLHGNRLQALPMGLRRLERLTNLNLSYNRLQNAALDVIAQIPFLKELKFGHNALSGSFPTNVCALQHLEHLDLQHNRLLGLPEALCDLVRLKYLNVSGNQLTSIPMEALQHLPLVELDASSNALIASLFLLGSTSGHPTLQRLRVSNGSLAALTFEHDLRLPQLQLLDVTNNRLTSLPSARGFPKLLTLTAADNKLEEMPVDFSQLSCLKSANFSSNSLRLVDSSIAAMENLDTLILSANPLRDKKFLTMTAADIKRELKARLAPSEADGGEPFEEQVINESKELERPSKSPSASWALGANATLDLARQSLGDDVSDRLKSFSRLDEVRQLNLSTNTLTLIPSALRMAQHLRVLNLSANALGPNYFEEELQLPALQELNLSKCSLRSLDPLTDLLVAPVLRSLDIKVNRLSGNLPALRQSFPSLTTLLASDNQFTTISYDALLGLHVVSLASNNIAQVPAEIGLLWDEGLRSLEIGANAFRVPNHRVLEKGTEATLRWLRDRIPAPSETPIGHVT